MPAEIVRLLNAGGRDVAPWLAAAILLAILYRSPPGRAGRQAAAPDGRAITPSASSRTGSTSITRTGPTRRSVTSPPTSQAQGDEDSRGRRNERGIDEAARQVYELRKDPMSGLLRADLETRNEVHAATVGLIKPLPGDLFASFAAAVA